MQVASEWWARCTRPPARPPEHLFPSLCWQGSAASSVNSQTESIKLCSNKNQNSTTLFFIIDLEITLRHSAYFLKIIFKYRRKFQGRQCVPFLINVTIKCYICIYFSPIKHRHIPCVSQLSVTVKNYLILTLERQERIALAYNFRGFSPLPLGLVVFGPWWGRTSWQGALVEQSYSFGQPSASYILSGNVPSDLLPNSVTEF
jgi:hypothetical protein